MLSARLAGEWVRFLEADDPGDAVDKLNRLIARLDESIDEVAAAVRLLAGSPALDLEELLRVSRTAIHEAVEVLRTVAASLRLAEPEFR